MQGSKFTSQDDCEYVYRESRYGNRSVVHEIKRKLKSLRIYIVIFIISIGGGACAVWLPDAMKKAESAEGAMSPLDAINNMDNKEKLMEMYKKKMENK